MSEFFANPGFLSSRSTLGSDISFLFSVGFTIMFLFAGYLAHSGRGKAHHYTILGSMTVMLAYFVYYYEIRSLGVSSFSDQLAFPGPDWVYKKVFKPVLIGHFIIVTLSVFISIYMIFNGYMSVARRNGKLLLREGRAHPSKTLWGVGFLWLAFLCWWIFLYQGFDMRHTVMLLSMGYIVPAGAAVLINWLLPGMEERHRTLGKVCVGFFGLLLMTNSVVYYLLYLAAYH